MSDVAPAAPAAPAGDTGAPADAGDAAPGTPAPPQRGPDGKFQAAPQAPRKLKLRLKDDGDEEEVEESWVRTHVQKGKAAAQLLSKAENARREAAKAREESEARWAKLKEKPWDVLRELGLDPAALARQQVVQQMEEESLTPEQRRIRELEGKVRESEERAKADDEKRAQESLRVETEKHKEEFSRLFLDTMKLAGLPREAARSAMHRMASLYQANEAAGAESTAEELAAHVVEGLRAEQRAVLQGMSLEEKVAWLGDDFLLELRRYDLQRLRAAKSAGLPAPRPAQAAPAAQPKPANPTQVRKGRWANVEALLND